MARSIFRDPAESAKRLLAGTPTRPVNLSEISRRTGIPHSTLWKWQKRPELITLTAGIRIANALNLTNEEWEKIRGRM